MILLRRRERLGNWLFQYCFARVLARRFGYRLAALPVPGFPRTFAEVPGEEVYGPVGAGRGSGRLKRGPGGGWNGRNWGRLRVSG